jgi:hypothetical protein
MERGYENEVDEKINRKVKRQTTTAGFVAERMVSILRHHFLITLYQEPGIIT